ncbi:unnamed protein product, partial [Rotaria sordida]
LNNKNMFTINEANAIKNKVNQLKQSHPGSGKTTLSKWLIINMAKQCLGKKNMLFDNNCSIKNKIPILIPIWKYVDQLKENSNKQKQTLLQYIYENINTLNSTYFNDEERKELSSFIIESLLEGNILVIFEGLDEVPIHIDRSDLLKEINTLLERGIDYDIKTNKLIYSTYD